MKRFLSLLWTVGFIGITVVGSAIAIPSRITYQGTLKENSIAVNTTKTMRFRITNQEGTQVYWSSSDLSVPVTRGHFAASLDPTGVDWQAITPYIEIAIEGQTLTPREPLNASVYATISASVVDGAITRQKLDQASFQTPGAGLVPAGAILMFAGSCPTGWTRFTALDNRFPMGSPTAGSTGGSTSHNHSLQVGATIGTSGGGGVVGTIAGTNGLGAYSASGGAPTETRLADTSAANHNPPYYTVVYCAKN